MTRVAGLLCLADRTMPSPRPGERAPEARPGASVAVVPTEHAGDWEVAAGALRPERRRSPGPQRSPEGGRRTDNGVAGVVRDAGAPMQLDEIAALLDPCKVGGFGGSSSPLEARSPARQGCDPPEVCIT